MQAAIAGARIERDERDAEVAQRLGDSVAAEKRVARGGQSDGTFEGGRWGWWIWHAVSSDAGSRPCPIHAIMRRCPVGPSRDDYRFTSEYGYWISPVFSSGGQRITSVFGSRNCSMSLDFTFWNCTASTRGSTHSPFEPNLISPTMVLNVPLRNASANLSSSRLFAVSIACCSTCM